MSSNFRSATKLLEEITKDDSYVSKLQGTSSTTTTGKSWDGRFTLGKIPQYDAVNDRFCKFSTKHGKKKRPVEQLPPPGKPLWAFREGFGAPRLNRPQKQLGAVAQSHLDDTPEAGALQPSQSLEQLFAKGKVRIVKLWDELGIPEQERLNFAQGNCNTRSCCSHQRRDSTAFGSTKQRGPSGKVN